MLDNKRFDFSQDSDLKPRLWEMIQQKLKENSPIREAVSFNELGLPDEQKIFRKTDTVNPPVRKFNKNL